MQDEYKKAMQSLVLSEDDKKRILSNVKKAAQEQKSSAPAVPVKTRPRLKISHTCTAAAACLAICAGLFVYNGIQREDEIPESSKPEESSYVSYSDEVTWVELDSIEEISEKTDCKTYTLDTISRKYRVKKVEVANSQRHVRITYKHKKDKDRILFEYKEADNAAEIVSQFEQENTLATERVDDIDVTLYGVDECDGMTWQEESCTFAVHMTKGRTKKEAKQLVSGTKEKDNDNKFEENENNDNNKNNVDENNPNAIGWTGEEQPMDPVERMEFLKDAEKTLGFSVAVKEPANEIIYKMVGEYESFTYYYMTDAELDNKRLIGYAGKQGCPEGVLLGYNEFTTITTQGIETHIYAKNNGEKAFSFEKEGIWLTFLIENWKGDAYEQIMGDILSTIEVSVHKEPAQTAEPGAGETPETTDGNKKEEPGAVVETDGSYGQNFVGESPIEGGNKANVSKIRQQMGEIQAAVREKKLSGLKEYVSFPLTVKGKGKTLSVTGEKEFLMLEEEKIFTDALVRAVLSYDGTKIKADTRTVRMGNASEYILCHIEESSVKITELCILSYELESNTTMPLRE